MRLFIKSGKVKDHDILMALVEVLPLVQNLFCKGFKIIP